MIVLLRKIVIPAMCISVIGIFIFISYTVISNDILNSSIAMVASFTVITMDLIYLIVVCFDVMDRSHETKLYGLIKKIQPLFCFFVLVFLFIVDWCGIFEVKSDNYSTLLILFVTTFFLFISSNSRKIFKNDEE